MSTTRIYVLFCVALVFVIALSAQEKAPTLTETQRLQLQNASLQVELWQLRTQSAAVELWQLRTQSAAAEYTKAREALNKLISSVTPAGWTLNEKMEFIKIQPEPSKPK